MQCDLLIIGGGINGVGIARDAAGRGLNVVLCEKGDLASETSSASTKLIHGGLRYLEHYEFKLVRESLRERAILSKAAPHLVQPLEFILPHSSQMRPYWLIQLGLFLYDHLGYRGELAKSKKVDLRNTPLKSQFTKGFSYTDCKTDDARLVILNALAAKENGARILTHTLFTSAVRHNDHWIVTLKKSDGTELTCQCKVIINASGLWVNHILDTLSIKTHSHIRMVKGSHIIVPKLYEGSHAYLLQQRDNRVVFIIPYQNQFHLIGTTDEPFDGHPAELCISAREKDYLCNTVNEYMKTSISHQDIVSNYCGGRALYNNDEHSDLSKMSREYYLELNQTDNKAPLLSIFGGKLTTYRCLAEEVLKKLSVFFPKMSASWTSSATLPGGDMANFSKFIRKKQLQYAWLDKETVSRLASAYGTKMDEVLGDAKAISDLGEHFGTGLYESEVTYLINHEWAKTADDILWRRSKLGLFISNDTLTNFLSAK